LAANAADKSFIIVAAHLGNWEVNSIVGAQRGALLANIYRKADNPYLEAYFRRVRGPFCGELIPKGRMGVRRMLGVLKEGKPLGLMIDQKLNEGEAIPFFGRDAMTPTAPAELAKRLDIPLIPVRCERLKASHFRVTIYPPMDLPNSGHKKADAIRVMHDLNIMLEGWIKDRPEQWFWVHRRWPK
jgi:KDO2-lipid IV(A) lauroyltransferase